MNFACLYLLSELIIMTLSEKGNKEITMLWTVSHRNIELRLAIEREIKRRRPNNQGICKEFIYTICKTHNRSMNVYFLPTTVSFELLGEFITLVDLELSEPELKELIVNIGNKVTTFGTVKCKKLNDTYEDGVTSTVEFNTDEISHTEYL